MNKVILVGLDGFRPEMMTPSLTPCLCALAQEGVLFKHHRSVFPSETYVNVSSIMTGAPPAEHGIVANAFLDRRISPTEPWIGSRVDMVEAGMSAYGGDLVTASTLGDRLGRSDRRLWILSSNSPGSARLKHPKAARHDGHLLFVAQDWPASVPRDEVARLVSRLGAPPVSADMTASRALQRSLADAFLFLAEETPLPDATVLWFSDPDHSFHAFGLGAEPTREALRSVDLQLGRVVEWWRAHPEHDRIQLIVTSDHGHITQTRRVDTAKVFHEAGFRVGGHLEEDAQIALVPGYCGSIRVRDGDAGIVAAVAEVLMAHPDAGMIFTRGDAAAVEGLVPGTFNQGLVMAAHERSADLVFTLGADDAVDPYGFVGTCRYDNPLPVGVGFHGGLHRNEMSGLLLTAGSAFGSGVEVFNPSSVTDLLPTILSLLGAPMGEAQGRTLAEAFSRPVEAPDAAPRSFRVEHQGYAQELHFTYLGERSHLDHGKRL